MPLPTAAAISAMTDDEKLATRMRLQGGATPPDGPAPLVAGGYGGGLSPSQMFRGEAQPSHVRPMGLRIGRVSLSTVGDPDPPPQASATSAHRRSVSAVRVADAMKARLIKPDSARPAPAPHLPLARYAKVRQPSACDAGPPRGRASSGGSSRTRPTCRNACRAGLQFRPRSTARRPRSPSRQLEGTPNSRASARPDSPSGFMNSLCSTSPGVTGPMLSPVDTSEKSIRAAKSALIAIIIIPCGSPRSPRRTLHPPARQNTAATYR